MGKASSAKKVARAARSGGGRRAGQQRNWVFPGAIAVIAILGVLLIAFARSEDAADADTEPILGQHWHAAYGINICGSWQEPLADGPQDPLGIHTHGDGVVHIHPFSSGAAGENARLSIFFDQVGLEVSDDRIGFPGSGDEYEAGDDECDSEAATVRLLHWSGPDDESAEEITSDIVDTRFMQDREVFALVFGPEDAEIGQPPTVPNLDQLTDVPPSDPFAADPAASTPSVPEGDDTTDSTDTTEAGESTDTTDTTDTADTTVSSTTPSAPEGDTSTTAP